MRDYIGDDIVDQVFRLYHQRVPAEADFVCYWVEKAWRAVSDGRATRAGLVTTNSIRGGANRRVVQPIVEAGALYEAWSDEPWALDGAAVRVSELGFGTGFLDRRLDGRIVTQINADLTGAAIDLTQASQLKENVGVAFMGDTKGGAFDVSGTLAREWLLAPINPNGRPNSDVLKPWRNGMDIVRRNSDKWIIDFGWTISEQSASFYEAPFRYALLYIMPERKPRQERGYAKAWWRHERPRPDLWEKLSSLQRYILTPRVASYRTFVWMDVRVCPDSATIAIAREDDTAFGILHSRFHELWALRMGTWLGIGNDPRYTPRSTLHADHDF